MVAVKVIDSEDPDVLTRCRREHAAGLAVGHPHLVRVLDGNTAEPPYFLVLEFVPGESLRTRLDRRGRIASGVALGVVRQMAEGLAALHTAGFVHGDVKPGNVMLPAAGRAVLVDLGFVHRPGELDFVLGTPNYLAPELCVAPALDTPAADLFALGVTLFESLAGGLPFPHGTQSEVMKSHRDIEPDRLSDHRGHWPRELVSFVDELLANDPDARPTAKETVRRITELQIAQMKRVA